MAENVIFETLEIDGFVYFPSYGAFMHSIAPSPFELIEGQEYKIIWDNEEYTRVAFAFTNPADNTSCIAVGNKMVATGENDGDLFAIVNDTTNNYTHLFSLENKTSHSVGIYQVVEEPKEDVGVLLANNRGKDVAYFGVENILVRTTEDGVTQSGQQIFTKGEAIEGVEINLALNDGDQTIKAPEGKLVKSAIIKKPDTLIPENIVKDVEIAGVIGTHVGSGSGGGGSSGEIFPLQTVDRFEYDSVDFFAYVRFLSPAPFSLTAGETYFVEWDGITYTLVARNIQLAVDSAIAMGNLSLVGAGGDDIPFTVAYINDGIGFLSSEPVSSHTIHIYQEVGRIEYTYNDKGEIISAKGIGLRTLPQYSFAYLTSLQTLDLSESPELTTIDNSFCYYSSNLLDVILPASVTSMGSSLFTNCSKIVSLRFLGTIAEWVTMERRGRLKTYAKNLVVYINGVPFGEGDDIELPYGITRISGYALADIKVPETVVIPDTVTSIGEYAFSYSNIKSIVIPDSVTELGSGAFQRCDSLTSITFGSGITTMGGHVLSYSTNVSSITFKEGMTVIGDGLCRYGTSSAKHKFTSIVIPASMKKIGAEAFYNASNLASATFTDPNGWYVSTSSYATSGTNVTLTNTTTAAKYLRSDYKTYYWFNGD